MCLFDISFDVFGSLLVIMDYFSDFFDEIFDILIMKYDEVSFKNIVLRNLIFEDNVIDWYELIIEFGFFDKSYFIDRVVEIGIIIGEVLIFREFN